MCPGVWPGTCSTSKPATSKSARHVDEGRYRLQRWWCTEPAVQHLAHRVVGRRPRRLHLHDDGSDSWRDGGLVW